MALTFTNTCDAAWTTVGVYWLLTSHGLKPIARAESATQRALTVTTLLLGAVLLFFQTPAAAGLNHRWLYNLGPRYYGVAITLMGASFAIWARYHLGANWSGRATIKQGHELIRSGPYSIVRHPIYTGLLCAALGTALAQGQIRQILALPCLFLGVWRKLRREEEMLCGNFPQYASYREEVHAIIPFIL